MEPYRSALTIDIRRLRVLRELRGQGTIAATAEALHLTPSAISQQIAALARELGGAIADSPGPAGYGWTPQAVLLLDHAAAIDAELERARADLAAFDQGIVESCHHWSVRHRYHRPRGASFATSSPEISPSELLDSRSGSPGLFHPVGCGGFGHRCHH